MGHRVGGHRAIRHHSVWDHETLEMLKNTGENADDTEAMPYNEAEEAEMQRQAEEEDVAEDSEGEDSDEDYHEKFYFYDCAFCKDIFRQKQDLVSHMNLCSNM